MPIAADTSPEAHAVQTEVYRRMDGAGRAQIMLRLSEMTRRTAAAGIRQRHPEYDAEQVTCALARLLYGDDVGQLAWPGRGLVGP